MSSSPNLPHHSHLFGLGGGTAPLNRWAMEMGHENRFYSYHKLMRFPFDLLHKRVTFVNNNNPHPRHTPVSVILIARSALVSRKVELLIRTVNNRFSWHPSQKCETIKLLRLLIRTVKSDNFLSIYVR